ncbi:hypothetical protein TrRE_jg6866 [Triparma retinervis]|uniref:Peptidase S26 domain-containing protein n=1 Tax=Triparma retinervis TaxID=2557542 RepID=A0A9W7E0P3_9STRA|nr:hypothetical protein TrRE_jg6866 [Triparma retinervis]
MAISSFFLVVLIVLVLHLTELSTGLTLPGQGRTAYQEAKSDGFGTKARNAAVNCTVGDTIVPLCRDMELRQELANVGVYAGVEYNVCDLYIEGSPIQSLRELDADEKRGVVALIKPRYKLRENLEREDWPVQVVLDSVPLWVSRTTYEAGTAISTLIFSLASFALASFIAFFVQFVAVPSPSMLPALAPGNVVLVTRTFPSLEPFKPCVGDVVFFDAPPSLESTAKSVADQVEGGGGNVQSVKGKQFLKRVVAVPGERVGVRPWQG